MFVFRYVIQTLTAIPNKCCSLITTLVPPAVLWININEMLLLLGCCPPLTTLYSVKGWIEAKVSRDVAEDLASTNVGLRVCQ